MMNQENDYGFEVEAPTDAVCSSAGDGNGSSGSPTTEEIVSSSLENVAIGYGDVPSYSRSQHTRRLKYMVVALASVVVITAIVLGVVLSRDGPNNATADASMPLNSNSEGAAVGSSGSGGIRTPGFGSDSENEVKFPMENGSDITGNNNSGSGVDEDASASTFTATTTNYDYDPPETQLYTIVRAHSPHSGIEFKNEFSYQNKALQWLEKTSDPNVHSIERILQRYALACIYYATNGVRTVYTDQMFKDAMNSYNNGNDGQMMMDTPEWIAEDGWLEHDDECSWYRVTCNDEGFVEKIELFSNRLTGSFPAEVVLLKETLEVIDIFNNMVYNVGDEGNNFLGELTNLKKLFYASTSFQYDGIPPAIGKLTNLVEYDCSFTLYFGKLRGEVFQDLDKLEYLRIDGNSFNSSIPKELAILPNLQYFYAQYTDLTGDLSFFEYKDAMPDLIEIWMDRNPKLTGTIPTHIGDLAKLRSFSVTDSDLYGTIPTEMGNLRLEQAWLYNNKLTGKIPSQLGRLVRLKRLGLEGNLLTGEMPSEICANRDPMGLLMRLEADCDATGQVQCTCCTCCGSACAGNDANRRELSHTAR